MYDNERRRTTLKNEFDEFPLNEAEEEFLRVCSMGEFTGSRPVIARTHSELEADEENESYR